MEPERRNLAWACLASAIAHGALIFLIAVNLRGLFGSRSSSSGQNSSKELSVTIIPIEIIPKPTKAAPEEKLPEAEVFNKKARASRADSPPRPDSQDCAEFYGGIGVHLLLSGLITKVPAGYPAARAGILPGDILIGDVESIKGKIGTTVKVVVIRGKKVLTFSLIREKICINKEGKIKQ